jgi:hypothetical protein
MGKFRRHHPDWSMSYDLGGIVDEMVAGISDRLR